jgi:flagellar protein FlgJ
MIGGIGASTVPPTKPIGPPRNEDDKLRDAASQLEGLFVQQLYKSMRDTVSPGDGIVSGGAGEDVFTGLMDQHLAAETPKHWESGIADALYRQMRGRAGVSSPPPEQQQQQQQSQVQSLQESPTLPSLSSHTVRSGL